MKKISRRDFLKASAIAGISIAASGLPAYAEENSSRVQFTYETATILAQSFIDSTFPEKNLTAKNPKRLYANDGSPFGYIVDFFAADESSSGYVVFDGTRNGALYEFSVDRGSVDPIQMAAAKAPLALSDDSKTDAYLIAPFTYAVRSVEPAVTIDMYGESRSLSSTHDTSSWDDIFIDLNDGYRISSMNYAPTNFISFAESEIEAATGSYACSVTAMLNCVPHYVKSFTGANLASDYSQLWSLSSTTVYKTENGIKYGSTYSENIGPAFTSYCSNKGYPVSYKGTSSPTFASFKSMIDRGDMGIFDCGININGTRVGHSMAVEGYAILKAGTVSEDINTLVVADGWSYNVRYLSFYYTRYTNTYGTFFS